MASRSRLHIRPRVTHSLPGSKVGTSDAASATVGFAP
jgi:hypothetical protein